MTIKEAIDRADGFNPNQYSEEDKVRWLSELDAQIFEDVIKMHEPVPEEDFVPYTMDDIGNKLLVPFPFEEVYEAYLAMKIDEKNQETTRYNNSLVVYQSKYDAFAKNYHKNHKPVYNKFRIW